MTLLTSDQRVLLLRALAAHGIARAWRPRVKTEQPVLEVRLAPVRHRSVDVLTRQIGVVLGDADRRHNAHVEEVTARAVKVRHGLLATGRILGAAGQGEQHQNFSHGPPSLSPEAA
jgi:hypothetical protein